MSAEQSSNIPRPTEQEFARACMNEETCVSPGTAQVLNDAFTAAVVGACEWYVAATKTVDNHPFALSPSDE